MSTLAERRRTAPAVVRWTAYIGIAIVFAIACAFLSHWQLTKNADRSEQLAIISANYDAKPVPIGEVLPAGRTLAATDQWRPVALTGSYLADRRILARNRVHSGTAAYEILVPFRLTDGRVVLVDRGWEPPGNTQSLPDSIPAPPTGTVTVVVRLQPSEPIPPNGPDAPRGQVPSINLPLVAHKAGVAALDTGAYGTLVSESPAPATAPQAMESPSDDPGPYLSYGVQWILFAIMAFAFLWYVIRFERRARREEAEDAAAVAELARTDAAA
ncbi:MAG TPA: SURF1 family protein, partial [Microbacterium sp.]|uniref:SURF1 family cytochrome oxidase biogenesis protein n=1 Tax=Microbacterium sp. TaxID=51671 RepID=UPI002B45AD14